MTKRPKGRPWNILDLVNSHRRSIGPNLKNCSSYRHFFFCFSTKQFLVLIKGNHRLVTWLPRSFVPRVRLVFVLTNTMDLVVVVTIHIVEVWKHKSIHIMIRTWDVCKCFVEVCYTIHTPYLPTYVVSRKVVLWVKNWVPFSVYLFDVNFTLLQNCLYLSSLPLQYLLPHFLS